VKRIRNRSREKELAITSGVIKRESILRKEKKKLEMKGERILLLFSTTFKGKCGGTRTEPRNWLYARLWRQGLLAKKR
jgi:hypothetical protein